VTARDLAALYLYENTLYVIEATGQMLKDALEHSARYYNQWTRSGGEAPSNGPLINPDVYGFNYDTAQGVTYRIDLTRPAGGRIVGLRFRGRPLAPNQKLRLAINSYRQAGGGGYRMFAGAKVLWQSTADVRELIIEHYSRKKVIAARADGNWRVMPEAARLALIDEATAAAAPRTQ